MNTNWKDKDDINLFLSSALTEEEVKLFLKYREEFEFERSDYCSDFMVEVFGIDKVSTVSNYQISTIKKQPHIYYFNYIIMGFDIDICCPMNFNTENDRFQYETATVSYKEKLQDDEYKDEANEIIRKEPVKDRHLFFK